MSSVAPIWRARSMSSATWSGVPVNAGRSDPEADVGEGRSRRARRAGGRRGHGRVGPRAAQGGPRLRRLVEPEAEREPAVGAAGDAFEPGRAEGGEQDGRAGPLDRLEAHDARGDALVGGRDGCGSREPTARPGRRGPPRGAIRGRPCGRRPRRTRRPTSRVRARRSVGRGSPGRWRRGCGRGGPAGTRARRARRCRGGPDR